MSAKYIPATYDGESFTCMMCGVVSQQIWVDLYFYYQMSSRQARVRRCQCLVCGDFSYWDADSETLMYPKICSAPFAHEDLPDSCKTDFEEARRVLPESCKAAAALLRLVIQKLLIHLGEKGENINLDIANLVKKGLSVRIQQSLDICRVIGNNAVHPGVIDLNENSQYVSKLFDLVNRIVEEMITRPKEDEDLYLSLPQGAREAIEKRDAPKP